MGKKNKTSIQKKREQKRKQDEKIKTLLRESNKRKRARSTGFQKRKGAETLLRFVALWPETYRIRSPDSFVAQSYPLERQVRQFVDHLYVKYPTPEHLYLLTLTKEGRRLLFPRMTRSDIRGCQANWFLAAAQGRSVADLLKGRLTRKETHVFLSAPAEMGVRQALIWAKMEAAGVPATLSREVSKELAMVNQRDPLSPIVNSCLGLIVRFHDQVDEYDLTELTSIMVRAKSAEALRWFRWTARSIRRMVEADQHGETVYRNKKMVQWRPRFETWSRGKGRATVIARELATNRELDSEGQWQHHCVGWYTRDCKENWSRIVSFRYLHRDEESGRDIELSRITVEVNLEDKQIVQIRGSCNRKATVAEIRWIALWAADLGLTIASWAN